MELLKTDISDLFIVKPQVHVDGRGLFFEAFNKNELIKAGIEINVLQTNISISQKNVVRGLHFQNPPFAQGKLVRVLRGAILDVAVDIRKDSPTFGKSYSKELNEENKLALWVPEGFAHGFASLADNTMLEYSCTNVYNKASEGGIHWNDAGIGIDWRIENPIISEKDAEAPFFKDFESQF